MFRRVVRDIDLGMRRIVRNLQQLSERELVTGLQAGDRTIDGEHDLAFIGAIQEFGAVVRAPNWWYHRGRITIPSRPFLRATFDDRNRNWFLVANAEVRQIINNNKNINTALGVIGNVIQRDVQRRINIGPWVPNHPWTVRHKGHNRPLIETGHMRNSIRYIIRRRGIGRM